MAQPIPPFTERSFDTSMAAASSSSPPRDVTPRSPKHAGDIIHPLKSALLNKDGASPRRMSESSSSPRSRSSSFRALDAATVEPVKNKILQQIEQVSADTNLGSRLCSRASLYILLAQAVNQDDQERESALQNAMIDLVVACTSVKTLDPSAITQLKAICKVADEFEAFCRRYPSPLATRVSQIGEDCLAKTRNIDAELGRQAARFTLPKPE